MAGLDPATHHMTPEAHSEYPRKLFGRRKGPKLSAHQERLLETLLPKLSLSPEPGRDPRSYFSAPVDDVWLEIGFGAGEHLLWQVEHHRHVGFIGAEPYVSGVAKLLSKLGAMETEAAEVRSHAFPLSPTGGEGSSGPNKVRITAGEGVYPPVSTFVGNAQTLAPPLPGPLLPGGRGESDTQGRGETSEKLCKNLRLYSDDARNILDALPPASLGRVFILFPDPWPKTRHHKRRFIQMETLDALARVMKPGAELRFASDDRDYLNWTLERLVAHRAFAWTAQCAHDWQTRTDDWPQTRYEAKALHGAPVFLKFVRI